MTSGGLQDSWPNCPDPETVAALRWLVLRTHGSMERKVAKRLEAEGFEAFLPSCWVERVGGVRMRSPRPVPMKAPLFPGYVFAGCAADQPWVPLISVRGVIEVMRKPGGPGWPGEVPVDFVEELRARLARDGGCLRLDPVHGDPVRVAGVDGVFDGTDAAGRVWVLLALFDRVNRVRVDARAVRRL